MGSRPSGACVGLTLICAARSELPELKADCQGLIQRKQVGTMGHLMMGLAHSMTCAARKPVLTCCSWQAAHLGRTLRSRHLTPSAACPRLHRSS